MSASNYYIDVALAHYRSLIQYDFETYESLIIRFLNKNKLTNSRDIHLFIALLNGCKNLKRQIRYDQDSDCFILDESGKNPSIQTLDLTDKLTEDNNPIPYALKGITEVNKLFKTLSSAKQSENKVLFQELKTKLNEVDRANLVEYIITNDNENLKIWLDEICSELFFNLFKSFLVGEYLILNNYSELLKTATCYAPYELDIEFRSPIGHDIANHIKHFLKRIEKFCKTLKQILENGQHDLQTISIGGFLNEFDFQRQYMPHSIGVWYNALNGLMDVTTLDHTYIATPENIRKLNHAFDCLEDLMKTKWEIIFRSKFRDEIYEPLKIKILLLIKQVIKQKGEDPDDSDLKMQYYFADEKIDEAVEQEFTIKGNIPHSQWDSEELEELFSSRQPNSTNDIKLFNKSAKSDYQVHLKQSPILTAIREKNPETFSLIKKYIATSNDWTAPFLYKTIRYVYCLYNKKAPSETPSDQEICDLLTQHLNKLARYINALKNCETPSGQMRFPFHLNFYSTSDLTVESINIDKNESFKSTISLFKEKQKHPLFFISLGAKPINIPFLSAFLDEYRLKANDILHQIHNTDLERITTNLETSQNEQRLIIEEQRVHKLNISQKLQDQDIAMKEYKKSVQEKLHTEHTHNLQMLGLLGAFIAFVSVIAAGIQKDISPFTFKIYLANATICILIFTVLMRIITTPYKLKWEEHSTYIKFNGFIYFILAILAVCLLALVRCDTNDPTIPNPKEQAALQTTPAAQASQNITIHIDEKASTLHHETTKWNQTGINRVPSGETRHQTGANTTPATAVPSKQSTESTADTAHTRFNLDKNQ